ncbi:MAG: hypothetical protein ABI760_20960 [Ferruginibacter sp.]
MSKISLVIVSIIVMVAVESCSKKTQPSRSVINTDKITDTLKLVSDIRADTSLVEIKADSVMVNKPAVKRKPRESTPKVIVVNDKYASKSVDGRFYYDLQGHRYWRNKTDGKYYLFNKSMLSDEAFKKPN